MTTNVLISVGNSDDKLTQRRWAQLVDAVRTTLKLYVGDGRVVAVHGEWFSLPDSPWQNANWCVETNALGESNLSLRRDMRRIAARFGQNSVAWTEGPVEFLSPLADDGGEATRCPDCSSPEPRLHPATQAGGEVSCICTSVFHDRIAT